MTTLEELLDEGRHTLEVTPEELAEARSRRNQINDALRDAFPDSRTYINGSVAHGDANSPLTDVDQGVVLPMSRKDVKWRLQVARDHITEAIAHEDAGRPALAQHELHLVLPGVVADSDAADLRREEASRLRAGATLITVPAPTQTRGWAPR